MLLSTRPRALVLVALAVLSGCYESAVSAVEEPQAASVPRSRLGVGESPAPSTRVLVVGPEQGSLFGLTLAVERTHDGVARLAVGAPGAQTGRGAAFVFDGPFMAERASRSATLEAQGTAEGDRTGDAVALGDIDGDGSSELVVSAVRANDSAGAVYVFGGEREGVLPVALADASVFGQRETDNLGLAVGVSHGSGAGELWIGVPHAGSDYEGGVIAFSGPLSNPLLPDAASSSVASPVRGGHAGTGLATGCDADGDGEDDLLVGAWGDDSGLTGGAAFLLQGPLVGDRSLSDARATFISHEAAAGVGTRVHLADVDDDGLCDVLIGAPSAHAGAGAIYGFLSPSAGSIDVRDADFAIVGAHAGDGVGLALATGDQDGDGVMDLWVGAQGDDTVGPESGAVYLVYGPPRGSIALGDGLPRFYGEAAGDYFGATLASRVDFDGDGSHDLAVGAWGAVERAGAVVIMRNL